ncbi:MAG: GPR endopeptidase [Clostridia bacterium]|nr:GPR endopeptidase [Clostridia bacterium]
MNFRTDLALERHESITEKQREGISFECCKSCGMKISRISVETDEAARQLRKPIGKYVTLEIPFLKDSADIHGDAIEAFAEEISSLVPEKGTVLVAGLGNDRITPDALGPESVEKLLATRHITPEIAESIGFDGLRSVAGIVPGVLGNTGIETAEIISGVCSQIKPSALIVIDALAAKSTERLGTTVQMCNTGVSPGAGVGNRRSRIDESSMGIPVIAIGVPTVVDAVTMTLDFIEKAGLEIPERQKQKYLRGEKGMMVTPKEIDNVISRAATFIAMGINKALQPGIPTEDIFAIMA